MTARPFWLAASAVALALTVAPGCDDAPVDPVYDNPFDPGAGQGLQKLDTPTAPRLQNATGTSATLVWDDASEIEEGYVVERAYSDDVAMPAGSFLPQDDHYVPVARLPANTTRHTDTTLVGSRPYRFRLRTVYGALRSDPSPALRLVWSGLVGAPAVNLDRLLPAAGGFVAREPDGKLRLRAYETLATVHQLVHTSGTDLSVNTSGTRVVVGPPYEGYQASVFSLNTGFPTAHRDLLAQPAGPLRSLRTLFVGEDLVMILDAVSTEPRPYALWRPSTGEYRLVPGFAGPAPELAAPGEGLAFGGTGEGGIYAFDVSTGRVRWTARGSALQVAASGGLVAVEAGTQVQLLDVSTGAVRASFSTAFAFPGYILRRGNYVLEPYLDGSPSLQAISSDGDLVALTKNQRQYVYSVSRQKVVRVLDELGHASTLSFLLSFGRGGLLYGASAQTKVIDLNAVWKAEQGPPSAR